MATGRNHSTGWRHAKIIGHKLEEHLAQELQNNPEVFSTISQRVFGESLGTPKKVASGGISAGHVPDVFGKSTPSKTDIFVEWSNSKNIRISLKKSTGGQVYLTSVERFFDGFEIQFDQVVPDSVRSTTSLFIGGAASKCDLVMKGKQYFGPVHKNSGQLQEKYQDRVVGITLDHHFPTEVKTMFDWFNANMQLLCEFIFSRGYALDATNFSSHLWYFVTEEPKIGDIDQFFSIKELSKKCARASTVCFGSKNGGSTIQFPFGFMQMHRPGGINQIQFHHSYEKLSELLVGL